MKPLAMLSLLALATLSFASDAVPAAAWRRPLGLPLENRGGKKPEIQGMIDDGYWQGAPVGGFGARTFSRSYRGDFERWHLKTGVHEYESVRANQFGVFVKREGDSAAFAQVLATDAPANHGLGAWKWKGLPQEGFATAKGIYDVVYEKKGYWFRTPEAWGTNGMYRASMYMRPVRSWSMEMMGRQADSSTVSAKGVR